ncbi:hypothetical protein LOTGIDRAFT_158010 [Lottia gigantea]|uniref:G-protein coupled receptors family 1 profile domain-containing protein n=1 Tax=Lottia gigantea TaxID=225164 RepID=V4AZX9_LOTGI|nr:hypothetical protein LOTGIDRAFT_158010 [Lottia gigantea]ESP00716.1 hypothetical protein LOTGIDRAFT_158010 [Lottia gigantea]
MEELYDICTNQSAKYPYLIILSQIRIFIALICTETGLGALSQLTTSILLLHILLSKSHKVNVFAQLPGTIVVSLWLALYALKMKLVEMNWTEWNFTQPNFNTTKFNFGISPEFVKLIEDISTSLSIIITVAILVTNLLLLVTVLTSPKLRNNVRYMLVVSLSCADLLTGMLGMPFFIDFGIQQKVTVACEFHVVLQVLVIHAHAMITSVGLLIINIHFVTRQYNFRCINIRQSLQLPVKIVVSMLPWILTVVIVTPLIITGLHQLTAFIWSANRCPLFLYRWALITMLILNYYLPMILVFITMGFIIKGWIETNRGSVAFRPALLNEEADPLHPKTMVVLNIVCFLLLLPIHIVNNRIIMNNLEILLILMMTSFQVSMLKPVFFASFWIFTPEVKQHLTEKLKNFWNRKSSSLPQYLVNKSYRDFVEEEGN